MTTPVMIPPHINVDALAQPDAFRAARDQLGLSQPHLAALLDVHVSTLRGWERERQTITRTIALAMAYLLAVPRSTWPEPVAPRAPWEGRRPARRIAKQQLAS